MDPRTTPVHERLFGPGLNAHTTLSSQMAGPSISELLVGLAVLILFVGSVAWVYRDAEARDKNGALVALLVAVAAWPLGLLVWVLVRPQPAS